MLISEVADLRQQALSTLSIARRDLAASLPNTQNGRKRGHGSVLRRKPRMNDRRVLTRASHEGPQSVTQLDGCFWPVNDIR